MDGLAINTSVSTLNAQANAAEQSATNLKEARTRAAIKDSAKEFEAMFLSQMMQPMFADVNKDNPFGGGNAEAIYSSLMVEEYGRGLAASGQVGIAPMLEAEMLRQQGLAQEILNTTEGQTDDGNTE